MRNLATTLRDQLAPASQSERQASEASLNELVSFFSDKLTANERAALTDFSDRVILASWHKIASRLQPLFPPGVTVAELPVVEKASSRREVATVVKADVAPIVNALVKPIVEENPAAVAAV